MLRRKTPSYPTSAQKREREQWAERFEGCWLCRLHWLSCRLEIHEIGSRAIAPLKWADKRNYLITCSKCHSEIFSWLPEAAQIGLKKLHDKENYDRVFINRIRGRADDAVSEGEVTQWAKMWEIIQR